jgi:hypothetical protein
MLPNLQDHVPILSGFVREFALYGAGRVQRLPRLAGNEEARKGLSASAQLWLENMITYLNQRGYPSTQKECSIHRANPESHA